MPSDRPSSSAAAPRSGASAVRPSLACGAGVAALAFAGAIALVVLDYRGTQLLPQTRLKLRLALAAPHGGDATPVATATPDTIVARITASLPDWQRPFLGVHTPDVPPREVTTIEVAHPDPASPTAGLQEAIDALPAEGGVITIGEGIFPLRTTVRLRSGVVLRGSGPTTVLRRARPRLVPLTGDVAPGDTIVRLAASPWSPGTRIALRDAHRYGSYTLHATVRSPNVAALDRPAPYAVIAERRGQASDFSSAVLADRARDVVVRDLVVDAEGGARAAATMTAIDFLTDAAVAIHWSERVAVLRVLVRDYPSDGISLQGGSDVLVRIAATVGVAGHGFHTGTSIRASVLDSVVAVRNGMDGSYFCADVTRSWVTRSTLLWNGGSGVGGLGGGNDRGNVVAGNTIARNHRYGVQVGETGNLVARNAVFANGRTPSANLRVEWSSWDPRLVANDTTPQSVPDLASLLRPMGFEDYEP